MEEGRQPEEAPSLPSSKALVPPQATSKVPTPAAQFSQIIRAVADGDLPLVIRLLDTSNASVNTRSRGKTALHDACKAGHFAIVQELMTRQAEVNITNRSGCTALHFATLAKDKESGLDIVKSLLDASAHVNVTSERMDTPLHYASYCEPTVGAADIVSELLSKRALVNARNRSSDSPLINAALNNHADALKVLLEAKADILQRNAMEKTAQDLARERGCTEALQVLEQMQDPLTQLSDTTQLMRTALSQMQTVDMLSADLRRQTLLTEAYESLAVAAVAELEDSARARLVHEALNALQERRSGKDSNRDFKLEPARPPLTPQQFSQALVTLLVISRSRSGSALLGHSGVHEVLQSLEQQAAANNIGHKELRELRASLQKSQAELLEMSVDQSYSSESTSSVDRHRQSKSPTTHSTGMMSETPSTATSGDCDVRMSRKRAPISHSRFGVGNRGRHSSSPCIISRVGLPLIDDERISTAEDLTSRRASTTCDSSCSPRHTQMSQGDEETYFSHSSGTATMVTKMPSTGSSGQRVSLTKVSHSSEKGEACGEDSTQICNGVMSSERFSSVHPKEDDKTNSDTLAANVTTKRALSMPAAVTSEVRPPVSTVSSQILRNSKSCSVS